MAKKSLESGRETTHAVLDEVSRLKKAKKIHALISSRVDLQGTRLLDVGAGAGHIAQYFSGVVGDSGHVVAVDRVNEVQVGAGFDFLLSNGLDLPTPDRSFDVVIYNHVIEHVGEQDDQLYHLKEIFRVLKPGGTLYLAVPNRWALIEPHYRLPLLNWLPLPLSSKLLRLSGRGGDYDCRLLTAGEVTSFLTMAGFGEQENVTDEALEIYMKHEVSSLLKKIYSFVPVSLRRSIFLVIPTLVFLARRP